MGQTLFTPCIKNEEQLISFALDMSTSVSKKHAGETKKIRQITIDKEEDSQGNKDFL